MQQLSSLRGFRFVTIAGVDSSQLKKWQAKKLHAALVPTLGYPNGLGTRINDRGFDPKDPLYRIVTKAFDAMRHLCNALHDLTCEGTGRPSGDYRIGPCRLERLFRLARLLSLLHNTANATFMSTQSDGLF